MPDHDETPLARAQRHVDMGETLVAEQRVLIEQLRSHGYPTSAAEHLLATLEASLKLMHEHLAHEQSKQQ